MITLLSLFLKRNVHPLLNKSSLISFCDLLFNIFLYSWDCILSKFSTNDGFPTFTAFSRRFVQRLLVVCMNNDVVDVVFFLIGYFLEKSFDALWMSLVMGNRLFDVLKRIV